MKRVVEYRVEQIPYSEYYEEHTEHGFRNGYRVTKDTLRLLQDSLMEIGKDGWRIDAVREGVSGKWIFVFSREGAAK